MRIACFYHSLISDWNHGNAHFLRGVVSELLARGHEVRVFEPADGWSRQNLLRDQGMRPLHDFQRSFPELASERYEHGTLDLDAVLEDADLVLVHEWNTPELVAAIGNHRRTRGDYVLLFHDTHHRSATQPGQMARYDLSGYDGVLAFGRVIRDLYLQNGWAQRAFTWHEAADTRIFRPFPDVPSRGDLVWVGNWGDDERADELREFLIEPVARLRLQATIHGVRYPRAARAALAAAGIRYGGWLANHRAPEVFAAHRVTVHVPRRPYVRQLPGIPTIRVFEALACGIPLVTAPWEDVEGLFTPGADFLVAENGDEMERLLRRVLSDEGLAGRLSRHGLETIRARHTCAHRVDELLAIHDELRGSTRSVRARRSSGAASRETSKAGLVP